MTIGEIANDPRKTQLAIAGLGLIGRRHADTVSQCPELDLAAIVDPSPEAQAEAKSRNVPWFETLSAMFQVMKPDGVILATPTKLHIEQARQCVEQACPVLVEKPLADDLAQAEQFVTDAERANVPVLVGHHRRHNPIIKKAHQIIKNGDIGDVRAIQTTCWFYKPDNYFKVAPWRTKQGAGPISVNLVHDIDLMRHLCGEVVSVHAHAAPSVRGFENEDVAAALLTFENGAIGTLSVSDSIVAPWSWEMTSNEYSEYPMTSQSAYRIGGSHGSLSIPDMKIWSHGEERDWLTSITAGFISRDSADPLVNQLNNFANVIAQKENPVVSGREGLKSLAVVAAIQESVNTGQTIILEHCNSEAFRSDKCA